MSMLTCTTQGCPQAVDMMPCNRSRCRKHVVQPVFLPAGAGWQRGNNGQLGTIAWSDRRVERT
eukprot:10045-Eustigmatos_ZCMA.PRE.1